MNKSFSYFRFAVKTRYGYRFLDDREKQWNILNNIGKKLSKKYKNYTSGEIIDTISDFINLTVKDSIQKHGFKVAKNISLREKQYLEKQLIEVFLLKTFIPYNPQFMPVSDKVENSWKVKDLTSGQVFKVIKRHKKGLFIFELI